MTNDESNDSDGTERAKGRQFKMLCVDTQASQNFALDKRIKDFDRRLLLVLIWEMDTANEVRRRHEELADLLGVSVPRISASMNVLARAGYVTLPHRGEIHVSPFTAWNNELSYRQKARQKFIAERNKQLGKLAERDERRELKKVSA